MSTERVTVDIPTSEVEGLGALACPDCGEELNARLEGEVALDKQADGSYDCSDATPEGSGETALYCTECSWRAAA